MTTDRCCHGELLAKWCDGCALTAAGVTVGPCERPHRRIARLPPGIPTCPICLYRNPDAEPGDTRPIGDHDCEVDRG